MPWMGDSFQIPLASCHSGSDWATWSDREVWLEDQLFGWTTWPQVRTESQENLGLQNPLADPVGSTWGRGGWGRVGGRSLGSLLVRAPRGRGMATPAGVPLSVEWSHFSFKCPPPLGMWV